MAAPLIIAKHFECRGRDEEIIDTYQRLILRGEYDPIFPEGEDNFHMGLSVCGAPDFAFLEAKLTPIILQHRAARSNDDGMVLICCLSGHGEIRQHGRSILLQSGMATWITNADASVAETASLTYHAQQFSFSRAQLAPLVNGDLDDLVCRPVQLNSPTMRLLRGYVGVLKDIEFTSMAVPDLAYTSVRHLHDLGALVAGATRDGTAQTLERGLRAARMRLIKADIAANLTHHDLSINTVCVRTGLTPRILRALFHAEQITFAAYVLQQRLIYVHRLLSDVRHRHLPISTLAYDAGFASLSVFNQAFRNRYNATPSDVREMARIYQLNNKVRMK